MQEYQTDASSNFNLSSESGNTNGKIDLNLCYLFDVLTLRKA